jgi:hypothetical protein
MIPHIDDRCANLNPPGLRADSSQQREGGAELTGEVVHAEVSPVSAEFFGSDCQIDRLQEGIGSRSRLRLG